MKGLDFAYFHFRAQRLRSGKCISPGPRCLVCDLAWEGWPKPHCKHENGSGIMDTNGNGEFTCHECGQVQVTRPLTQHGSMCRIYDRQFPGPCDCGVQPGREP